MAGADDIETLVDAKIGVFVEHMNDQFERVLEAVGEVAENTQKIPKMSERVEKLEHDVSVMRLDAVATTENVRLLKIRSEKQAEALDEIKQKLDNGKSPRVSGTQD